MQTQSTTMARKPVTRLSLPREDAIYEVTPKKRPTLLIAALIAGVLLISSTFLFSTRSTVAQAPQKAALPFLAAPGMTECVSGLCEMAFQVNGRIRKVHVEECQRVKQGQLLAELEHDDLTARLDSAKAAQAESETQLKILEISLDTQLRKAESESDRLNAIYEKMKSGVRVEELERARAELRGSEAEWRRRQENHRKYAESPESSTRQMIDMSKGEMEIAQAQMDATRTRVKEMETGSRKEDIAQAEAAWHSAQTESLGLRASKESKLTAAAHQINRSRADVKLIEAELEKCRLYSPVNGVVIWKHRSSGESVSAMPLMPVATVADDSNLRVRADIDEADYARIKPGMKARVRADAFGEQEFAGSVEWVSHAAGPKRFSTGEAREMHDVRIVPAVIKFEKQPPLKLGLRVTVYVDLQK